MNLSDKLASAGEKDAGPVLADTLHQLYRAYMHSYGDKGEELLSVRVVVEPYPTEENATFRHCTPQHSVSLSFTLGYRCGATKDASRAVYFEYILRTLETLSLEGVRYGIRMQEDDPTNVRFIVAIPGDPKRHLELNYVGDL